MWVSALFIWQEFKVSRQCTYIHPSGRPCKNWATKASDPPRCHQHGGKVLPQPRAEPCSETLANGDPCKRWAVLGSDPPRCAAHAGRNRPLTGRDNPNWRHGLYEGKGKQHESLEAMIDYLFQKQYQADAIFDLIVDPHDLLRLLAIHFKNARIIGKLLRAKQALDRDKDDLLSALGPALDLIEAELENK